MMNTYNVSVNGREIISCVPSDKLEGELKILRGLVWAQGGSDRDIRITLNKIATK